MTTEAAAAAEIEALAKEVMEKQAKNKAFGENFIWSRTTMNTKLPEKARLLKQLQKEKFNIPDFIYVSASDFKNENFEALEAFLKHHRESFKVITRSVHPAEEFFKGGTFDSLETYSDLGGILYARKKIIK